jgi:hypothetical protein
VRVLCELPRKLLCATNCADAVRRRCPGSHRGKIYSHHCDGVFSGAVNDPTFDPEALGARPLQVKAGGITVHHVRLLHGSAANNSDTRRRFLLFQFGAADAWPLIDSPTDLEAFDRCIVTGKPSQPRVVAVPVVIPMPDQAGLGPADTLYDLQAMAPGHRDSPEAKARRSRRSWFAAASGARIANTKL